MTYTHLDTNIVESFDELTADQVGFARKTLAANAIDATDAANLMMARGIHPSQEDKNSPLLTGVTQLANQPRSW